MLDHSFAAGYLPLLKPIMDKFPSDAHKGYTFAKIPQIFPSGAYLDLWPFSKPFLVVTLPQWLPRRPKLPIWPTKGRMCCENVLNRSQGREPI